MVSLGVRQRVTPRLTLLGTAEWTNWSRIGTSKLTASGAPAAHQCCSAASHTRYLSSSKRRLVLCAGGRVSVERPADCAGGRRLTKFPRSPIGCERHWYQTITGCGPRLAQVGRFPRLLVRSRLLAHLGAGSVDQHHGGVRQSVFHRSAVNYIGSVNATCRRPVAGDGVSLGSAGAGAGGQADHREINPRGREGAQGPAGDAGLCISERAAEIAAVDQQILSGDIAGMR